MGWSGRVAAVLFDLDDTLFDHRHSADCGLREIHRSFETLQSRSFAEIEEHYRRSLAVYHPRVLSGELSLEESRHARFALLHTWCGGSDSAETIRMTGRFREAYLDNMRCLDGAEALLARVSGRVSIAVVTNNEPREQKTKLRTLGLDRWVDHLITAVEVGKAKPHSEIFRVALERTGASPDEAVMVGDSWPDDIVGARASGIRAVWVNRDNQTAPDPEVATIRSFEPVAAALEAMGLV